MQKKFRIDILLNIILVIIGLSYTYSWMVTEPSYGEIVDYKRELIISSTSKDISIYKYDDSVNDYVMYTDSNIIINNMAPNDKIRFKIVIKNNKSVASVTDIVFANIYGDIDYLKSYITINGSSPQVFSKNLENDLRTTTDLEGIEVTNYMKFYDNFMVDAGSESTIYFNISLDKIASNEIVDKTLVIDNIIFLNA